MKLSALLVAYNENEWIKDAVKSVVNVFDEVVIIEGAYKVAIESGSSPRSNDGTIQTIEDLKAEHKNIVHFLENEKDAWHQLNKGLEYIKSAETDWILLLDADEIWNEKDLVTIKKILEKGDKKGIYQYWANHYNFMNSFSKYHEARARRFFKITPQCRFVHVNSMEWPDHGKPVDTERKASHIAFLMPNLRFYHYTGMKSRKRWETKKNYFLERDKNNLFKKMQIDENGIERGDAPKKLPFTKKHPAIVYQNRIYKFWERDPESFTERMFLTNSKEKCVILKRDADLADELEQNLSIIKNICENKYVDYYKIVVGRDGYDCLYRNFSDKFELLSNFSLEKYVKIFEENNIEIIEEVPNIIADDLDKIYPSFFAQQKVKSKTRKLLIILKQEDAGIFRFFHENHIDFAYTDAKPTQEDSLDDKVALIHSAEIVLTNSRDIKPMVGNIGIKCIFFNNIEEMKSKIKLNNKRGELEWHE
jgi:hypothetical protein